MKLTPDEWLARCKMMLKLVALGDARAAVDLQNNLSLAAKELNTRALPAGGGGDAKDDDLLLRQIWYGELVKENWPAASGAVATMNAVRSTARRYAALRAPSDAAGMRGALTAARKYIAAMAEVDQAHDDFALLAQIDAALSQPQGDRWRSMDSAPKSKSTDTEHGKLVEGEYVLGYIPDISTEPEGCMVVIWWEPNIDGGCWCSDAGENIKPTHWMPLPSAPQTEERE